jgi:hypothetical protein
MGNLALGLKDIADGVLAIELVPKTKRDELITVGSILTKTKALVAKTVDATKLVSPALSYVGSEIDYRKKTVTQEIPDIQELKDWYGAPLTGFVLAGVP